MVVKNISANKTLVEDSAPCRNFLRAARHGGSLEVCLSLKVESAIAVVSMEVGVLRPGVRNEINAQLENTHPYYLRV